ncbi:MAG TPA: MCE family protein, partial [Desulfobacterales bacterium]|nr:MCE family protein [Desulfobacterales bacterium]
MADEKTLNPKGKTLTIELAVGAFILAGFACLAYLSIRLARMDMFGSKGYEVVAVFSDCGGLKPGATVSIAGVDVGRVRKITLKN